MFRYSMQLIWSDEDQEYVASIPEFPNLNAIGQTPEEAVREAQVVADLFLEDMAECGEEPPEPKVLSGFRGEIRVRMPRTLHHKLAGWAAVEHVSLNMLMVTLLAEGIGARGELPAMEVRVRGPHTRRMVRSAHRRARHPV